MNQRTTQRGIRCALAVAPVAMLAVLAGCLSTPPEEHGSWPAYDTPVVKLEPGDVIQVKFTYWPELDDEQAIRPDGLISLKLVGDVKAQDLTPDELRTDLLSRYAEKLKEPDITVVVSEYTSHRVYVGGEVLQPGVLPIQGKLTVLEAIMQAGGFNKTTAKLANVVVVRQRDGKYFSRSLDLRKAIEQPESDTFTLEPRDVVFVPRTTIDKVDQFVDQYINQIIPRSVYWNLTYDLNQQEFDNESRSFQIQAVPGL